jgi:two-component system NtrC family sensor kinase
MIDPAPTNGSRRVLVVEDEQQLRDLLGEILAYCNCQTDLVESGPAAMELLERRRYALILLDFRLAGIGGAQLYRMLFEREPEQANHVVFMTGDDPGAPPLREFLAEVGRPAITKPFGVRKIENLVRETIGL